MRHVRWILPLLFIVVTSAAPTLPQQGASAVSAVLKAATDRGDVPGVAVAVVNRDGLLYNAAAGLSRHAGRAFVIDVTAHSPSWRRSLSALGFQEQRALTRMSRGNRDRPWEPRQQFAILGPEFG